MCGIVCLVEQADEFRSDDGSRCVALSGFKGLSVADAEAYHSRITQMHGVDALEVSLLLSIELLLYPCGGCRRNHIDKSVGMLVDESDAFVARFGCDEHDDSQVITVGDGFVVGEIVFER